MKNLFYSSKSLLALALACALSFSARAADKKGGAGKALFDGKSLAGWHSFKKTTAPDKGWDIQDGCLHHIPNGGGGDLISDATYENFDLSWEWKVAEGANSGLKYFVSEERKSAIGHEYQLIDDDRHPDAKLADGKRVTASFYDVLKPKDAHPKKAGEWNTSRVLVNGSHVEHWLNGAKVLEYELGSAELLAAVQESKFKKEADFGKRVQCHLLLQDHHDEIWFRNLKIKELPAK